MGACGWKLSKGKNNEIVSLDWTNNQGEESFGKLYTSQNVFTVHGHCLWRLRQISGRHTIHIGKL